MATIVGHVRDIQPKQKTPTLELYFPEKGDRSRFPAGNPVNVRLEMPESTWTGTMSTQGSNPPYFHTWLTSVTGERSKMTEFLLSLNVAEYALIEFDMISRDHLRFARVLDRGKWRDGNELNSRRQHKTPAQTTSRRGPPHSASGQQASKHVRASFPFEDREKILQLADRYWSLISTNDASEERKFEQDFQKARTAGYMAKELFLRAARWKSVRQTPNYEANSEQDIRFATSGALDAATDEEALRLLMNLKGVALRTASALLHWLLPERFPILDVRVLAALAEPIPSNWDDFRLYHRVSTRIRDLAMRHSLDLRTLDRALWSWDKLKTSS